MPMNNNQKVQTAAARLAKLPLVRSACTSLSVLYTDTKCIHPRLRSVCEGLESSVAALVSPVIVKMEPQISVANGIACKSLDWLEATFPVLHAPTEQVVATAKIKMQEIQDVMSVAVNGAVDCVQHTATWVLGGTRQQAGGRADQPLVERAISVASVGLDSALVMSEALMDQVFPPTEEDEEEEIHLLESFEAATPRGYPVRLVSLAARLWRKSHHVVMENLSRGLGLFQELQTSWQTLALSVHGLPQHVQHQLVSVFFFFSQMYNLSCPPPKQQPRPDRSPTHRDVVHVNPQATPIRSRRPTRSPMFDNGCCNVKECVRR